LEIVYQSCCGLDVHKKSIVACIINSKGKQVRTFGTMTNQILDLVSWIKSKECECVAMESTGSYWKPIYNLLELEEIKAIVVNAQHIKSVPGRKTDVKDAEWIANLLRHGLVTGSFIPDRQQRELRELIRYRRSLIEERTREINRIQKVLEGANIKITSVASNIMGVSSKAILKALVEGLDDPKELAQLAQGNLRKKLDELEKSLQGLMGNHQRMLLATQLDHIRFLDDKITSLDKEVADRTIPFEEDLELLDTIPGIARRTAEHIIAEIGTDMDQFPSAAHLASWVGLCPGQNESAGKRKSSKTRKGNKFLRHTLAEAARAGARTKNTYISAQYNRIAARRGSKRAAIAVAHTMLVMCYHILKKRQPYFELGADYFDQRKKSSVVYRAVKKLESLGYKVQLEQESISA
jgi:transposase